MAKLEIYSGEVHDAAGEIGEIAMAGPMLNSSERSSRDDGPSAVARARKTWEQAAFRNGMFFILFPAIVPFPLVTTFHWVPHSLAVTLAVVIGWIIIVFCSIAYGWFRIRRYKRDHPFVQ